MAVEIDSLSLEKMRAMRQVSSAVYKKFTESKEYFKTHAFCFYEGEDGKYYNSRIEEYWGDRYIPLIAGKKSDVLQAMAKITSDSLYDDVCVMFFIDRDYDAPLAGTHKHLYETPCYSIENLYVQESVFEKVLRAEFGLSVADSDFHKCKKVFNLRLAEFNAVIRHFNAILKYVRQYVPENSCCFGDIKTTDLVTISINEVVQSQNYGQTIGLLTQKINIKQELMALTDASFELVPDVSAVFRGKNQLDFFVTLVNILRDANKQGGFFSEKLKRVRINITNNRLSELSQYAVTPPELKAFLLSHCPVAVHKV